MQLAYETDVRVCDTVLLGCHVPRLESDSASGRRPCCARPCSDTASRMLFIPHSLARHHRLMPLTAGLHRFKASDMLVRHKVLMGRVLIRSLPSVVLAMMVLRTISVSS